jgi:hypothetical protein
LDAIWVSGKLELHFLAGLKIRDAFGWNLHTSARFGIASHTRLPLPRAKDSKTPDLDLIPAAQSARHTVKNGFDDQPRVLSRRFHDARDFFDQLSLGHY